MEGCLRPTKVARLPRLNAETVYRYIKKGDLLAARLSNVTVGSWIRRYL